MKQEQLLLLLLLLQQQLFRLGLGLLLDPIQRVIFVDTIKVSVGLTIATTTG